MNNRLDNRYIGRTKRDYLPAFREETINGVTTKYLHLRHETWHPNFQGSYFLGKEILSKLAVPLTRTVEYQARLRLTATRTGLVSAFFTYGPDQSFKDDEIDYEFLGNRLNKNIADANKKFWLNTWNDDDPNGGFFQETPVPTGIDVTQWQTYKIRWVGSNRVCSRVEWQVLMPNNTWQVIRTVSPAQTSEVPNEDMRVHFNIWAPTNNPSLDGYFLQAYDSTYQPVSTQANNIVHVMDVDWVKVLSTIGTSPILEDPDVSSVTLSSVSANASSNTVSLSFTGPLDSAVASDIGHYIVAISGGTQGIHSASYQASTNTVHLVLEPGLLKVGDRVTTSSYNLKFLQPERRSRPESAAATQ